MTWAIGAAWWTWLLMAAGTVGVWLIVVLAVRALVDPGPARTARRRTTYIESSSELARSFRGGPDGEAMNSTWTSDSCPTAPTVTLVHTENCHLCSEAIATLTAHEAQGQVRLRLLPADSPEGGRLLELHRPALFPLVTLDGEFFSAGRLPRRKLARRLEETQFLGRRSH
ncbi:MAG TPA: hypothetical protein VFM07_07655 [Intrasporangium sp.]|nr:hypothetical protein [Intrasporangium sp.]